MRSPLSHAIFLRFTFFALLFSSCSPSSPPPTATLFTIPTLTPTLVAATPETATPDSIPFGDTVALDTAIPSLPNPHYILNVTLDYRRKRLTVEEIILYPNATGETLNDLVLAVMPNIWEGVFKLNKLELNGAPSKKYKLDGQRLTIQLPTSLPPNGTVELSLA